MSKPKPKPTPKPPSEHTQWALDVIKHAQANPSDCEMPCPRCGHAMQYAVSAYNGHVAGRCDNCDFEFMQ